MDTDILKQNMDADGKQSIHVTPDEAELVRFLEGGRDPAAQSGYDFMETLDYSYDPDNPPVGMTDEQMREVRSDDNWRSHSGITNDVYPPRGDMEMDPSTIAPPSKIAPSISLRPRARASEAAMRSEFYEEKDRLTEWEWNNIQTLAPTSDRMETPEMFLSNPMSTSGLAYVDDDMNLTEDMRGNRTPEHLQRKQDDIVSYLTSERSRNMIEDLRMSMPRQMQDSLDGSMFVEAGRDGTHSLFTGNDETGYTELAFGPGEEGFMTAMDTVRRGFSHADEVGDFNMDAGFWGRATSARDYSGYSNSDLTELFNQGMAEVRSYYQYEPKLAAEAMRVVDQIADEQRRRGGRGEARGLGYSRRVVNREIGRRARRMMGQGRL